MDPLFLKIPQIHQTNYPNKFTYPISIVKSDMDQLPTSNMETHQKPTPFYILFFCNFNNTVCSDKYCIGSLQMS